MAQTTKKSACNAGDPVQSLGWEDPLENRMAIYSRKKHFQALSLHSASKRTLFFLRTNSEHCIKHGEEVYKKKQIHGLELQHITEAIYI